MKTKFQINTDPKDGDDLIINLNIKKLNNKIKLFNTSFPWGVEISKYDVRRMCVGFNLSQPDGHIYRTSGESDHKLKVRHVERIAWFVINGWEDPIEIDFGCPDLYSAYDYLSFWPITDGNHRYAAAIIRGDKTILAGCSGQMDIIMKYHMEES